MLTFMLIFAGLAGIIHTLFFLLESVWWMRPNVYKTFRLSNDDEARLTRPLAFNQGFYNLFLTLGIAAGLIMVGMGNAAAGYAVVTYACLFMLGAAMVLFLSNPKMIRGVILQGLPPLGYLMIFIWKSMSMH